MISTDKVESKAVADLRGGARDARPEFWTKISSFSCCFQGKLVKQ